MLARCELQGWVPISVNFLGVLTVDDVAERIERAYSRQLDGPLKRWYAGLIRTLRPTISGTPGGVGVAITPQARSAALLERLALPLRLHERHAKQCVIAFDEFQEVVRIPGVAGTFRSELEQHGTAAAYVFSGSHPGLMRDTFADRRHSFFAQAAAVPLGELPADALEQFISARFAAGRRDPGDGLGPLLDPAAGHPQRSMQFAHHSASSKAAREARRRSTSSIATGTSFPRKRPPPVGGWSTRARSVGTQRTQLAGATRR